MARSPATKNANIDKEMHDNKRNVSLLDNEDRYSDNEVGNVLMT